MARNQGTMMAAYEWVWDRTRVLYGMTRRSLDLCVHTHVSMRVRDSVCTAVCDRVARLTINMVAEPIQRELDT